MTYYKHFPISTLLTSLIVLVFHTSCNMTARQADTSANLPSLEG